MTFWPDQPHHQSSGGFHGDDHTLLLGQVLERTAATQGMVAEINHRLMHGDGRMNNHEHRISVLEAKPQAKTKEEIPRAERTLKRGAAYLLPASFLYATGLLEPAAKLFDAVSKFLEAVR